MYAPVKDAAEPRPTDRRRRRHDKLQAPSYKLSQQGSARGKGRSKRARLDEAAATTNVRQKCIDRVTAPRYRGTYSSCDCCAVRAVRTVRTVCRRWEKPRALLTLPICLLRRSRGHRAPSQACDRKEPDARVMRASATESCTRDATGTTRAVYSERVRGREENRIECWIRRAVDHRQGGLDANVRSRSGIWYAT